MPLAAHHASHNHDDSTKQIVRDIYHYLADRLLLNGEKSLDLLHGLIVVISWYQFFDLTSRQLMNLLHLGLALIIDLGLNLPQESYSNNLKFKGYLETMIAPPMPTIEESRTLLGCYHLSLVLALSYSCRRFDHMRWTKNMDRAIEQLEKTSEVPSDAYIVQVIRLQRIVERHLSTEGLRPSNALPVRLYVACFTNELQRFQKDIPPELRENKLLRMHVLNAEICLSGSVLTADCENPMQKVEALHPCLLNIDAFFDHLVCLPTNTLRFLPFSCWAHLRHALELLAQLSFLTAEGWDREHMRNLVSFPNIIDSIAAKLLSVQEHERQLSSGQSTPRFSEFATIVLRFKTWYQAKIANNDLQTRAETGIPENVSLGAGIDGQFDGAADVFGDLLWPDFALDWTSTLQH